MALPAAENASGEGEVVRQREEPVVVVGKVTIGPITTTTITATADNKSPRQPRKDKASVLGQLLSAETPNRTGERDTLQRIKKMVKPIQKAEQPIKVAKKGKGEGREKEKEEVVEEVEDEEGDDENNNDGETDEDQVTILRIEECSIYSLGDQKEVLQSHQWGDSQPSWCGALRITSTRPSPSQVFVIYLETNRRDGTLPFSIPFLPLFIYFYLFPL